MSSRPGRGAELQIRSLIELATFDHQPICLDSGPLIDYVAQQQPTTSLLEPMLLDPAVSIVISTITVTEAVTRPAMQDDRPRVDTIVEALRGIPGLRIVDFDQGHAVEAAIVRGLTGLKLLDAAIVATARLANASALLGNDRQWRTKPLGVPYHHIDDILALS